CTTHAFQACSFGHSDNSPKGPASTILTERGSAAAPTARPSAHRAARCAATNPAFVTQNGVSTASWDTNGHLVVAALRARRDGSGGARRPRHTVLARSADRRARGGVVRLAEGRAGEERLHRAQAQV